RDELPAQQFNTWIRPLQVEAEGDELRVYAPNRFVLDWVNEKYLGRLLELLGEHGNGIAPALSLLIGSRRSSAARTAPNAPVSAAVAATLAQQAQAQPVAQIVLPSEPVMEPVLEPVTSGIEESASRSSFDSMAEPSSAPAATGRTEQRTVQVEGALKHTSYLNRTFTF
ncbi:DnaA N-terminal domain-containing protein, partial [Citrobacter cronae]|uniref:DnaA N-terminal domain-containing protein n=2 Tax=Gammaproteobacteria TaxID=1236 RepID=UPI0027D26CEF